MIKTKNINIIYVLIISGPVIGLFCFYLAFELRDLSHDISSLFKWRYIFILPVTFLFLLAFAVVSCKNSITSRHITIPSVLFLSVFGFFIYFGTFDHYLRILSKAMFTYDESVSSGYNYTSIALASWIVGYSLSQNLRGRTAASGKTLVWDRRRLYAMNLVWAAIGLTAFALFFAFYVRGIPFLQGISPNVSDELRELLAGRGHNISLIAINGTTMALMFSGVYLVNFRKDLAIVLVFLSALTCFLLWGARIHIVFPFILFFVLLAKKKRYPLSKVLILLTIFVLIGAYYGIVRNRTFFSRPAFSFSKKEIHVAPEFRDTLGVISYLDDLRRAYNKSYYLEGIYLTSMPGKLWSLMGVDKAKLYNSEGTSSAWIIAKITRGYEWVALRPGIMAQTLIAFGPAGMIVLFIFYGVLFAQLDRICSKSSISSIGIIYGYIISILLAYSLLVMTESVFTRLWYFTYGYLLTTLIAARRSSSHTEGA